jgi:hypothetical protein
MALPTLIDPTTSAALAYNEERLCDIAGSLIDQAGTTEDHLAALADHLAAVQLANELAWAHQSDHPADRDLYRAAVQLKHWHLCQLDNLTTVQ